MNKHLIQLIDISNLDKEIDSFEPRIKEANKELDVILDEEKVLKRELDELEATNKDLSLAIQKNENHLSELSNKLEDIAKKTKLIKTEKESKALSLEEELAKEQITFANEEIARLNTLISSKNDNIKELKNKISELNKNAKEVEQKVEKEVKEIKGEQEKIFKQKEELVAKMDQKIISFYEKIRKWAKNTGVVSITRQACGGCFMRINDKTYSDVIRSDDIITCPHCGRILYNEETKEA
ncbi:MULTISPECIES: zinc ribbon domain-containing protein [Helicobacter]|uniref:Zinc ribbon domain-containing protein n=1 Tax=Helicobacter ibis TaxID=2962633 RepID=A0ABT4VEF6_9HELI|nr:MULTISPECIES: zinc ribbon domain-containing protein [Helicobacter]MDA3966792.1 zinc ribbon domain-containing protein [Helicobacter sp. WB40]MDA3968426.1 zinc ribbon domain-containing protein [Helicobacter ibis]